MNIVKLCAWCSEPYDVKPSHASGSTYCSKQCMGRHYRVRMTGPSNPNFRDAGRKVCETCGGEFRHYNKRRRFCNDQCKGLSPTNIEQCRRMSKVPRPMFSRRGGAKRVDANHHEIVAALQAVGASVIDCSALGGGAPDLIVGFRQRNYLIEIKNPKTKYGRAGLNSNQRMWCALWRGEAPVVVMSQFDALRAIGVEVES